MSAITTYRCWQCFKSFKPQGRSVCRGCKVARYCSAACQLIDWKNKFSGHKADCMDWMLCKRPGQSGVYGVTRPAFPAEVLDKARVAADILSRPELKPQSKQHLMSALFDNNEFLPLLSLDATWLIALMHEEMSAAKTFDSPSKNGNYALLSFMNRSNNQTFPFRAKNILAFPGLFKTLIAYGHHLVMGSPKNHFASLQFWRFMGCMLVHPVPATVAVLMLHQDQQTPGMPATTMLKELMASEKIKDDVQGLIYQVVAVLEELVEGPERCGVDGKRVIARITADAPLYSFARPLGLAHIASHKGKP